MNNLEMLLENISKSVLPKYAYNQNEFIPGKSTIYYSGPYWDDKEIFNGLKAFLTGKWLPSGEYVKEFQDKFSEIFDTKYSHMVNSGSSANLVMLAALKKKYGWANNSEIIVSPVGFPTTIAPIVQNSMVPTFVDIEMNTLNFNIDEIVKKINKNTVGIFVSPVLGNPPDMDLLLELAFDNNIILIGDNCDSLGTKWNNSFLTINYKAWSTSFYPAHHITTGEGGMISTDDEELINLIRSISWWGRDCYCVGENNLLSCGTCGKRFDTWIDGYNGIVDHKYYFSNMGYNLKPLDMQGAIGLAQLDKLEKIDFNRKNNFNKFSNLLLKYIKNIKIANSLPKADPSWFGVPLIFDNPDSKNNFQNYLESNKIQTRNYFAGNILLHPGYKHLGNSSQFSNANKALSHVFFVGCPPHYNDEIFRYIEDVLKKWK